MKREYHYTISRTDRICLVSFVVMLLAWELVKGLFPGSSNTYQYVAKEKEAFVQYSTYDKKKNYPDKYRNYQKEYWKKDRKYSENNFRREYPKLSPPTQPIPIMTATLNELISMGFSTKTAFNIQKYISSGGTISTPEALMKIYGMDSTQLVIATPYIIYATVSSQNFTAFPKKEFSKPTTTSSIDLNKAGNSELESINGIGSVLAERIIKFRESLGGFIRPEQLQDCYGITPEVYEQVKTRLTVSGEPKMIRINQADLLTLSHPYLSKKMLRILKAYKDHHGPFNDAADLKKAYPPDSSWCEKVLPYISFE